MKVGIIGAGKVGCALAQGLKNKGFDITGIYSKSEDSCKLLSSRLNAVFDNDLIKTISVADVVFITVPDAEIEKMAVQIDEKVDAGLIMGKTFFHCSGALSSDVLECIQASSGHTASLHPIQTFADRLESWKAMEGIYFGFEGDAVAQKQASEIVQAFHGTLLVLKKEDKPLYHAAACILSNYTVTLSYITVNLLSAAGIGPEEGIRAFAPLLLKTSDNIKNLGSIQALTGPIARGDSKVVESHKEALNMRVPEYSEVYRVLGELTVSLAVQKGSIHDEKATELMEILRKKGGTYT